MGYTSGIGSGCNCGIGDMPQHDLKTPNFARLTLERILTDCDSFIFNYSKLEEND